MHRHKWYVLLLRPTWVAPRPLCKSELPGSLKPGAPQRRCAVGARHWGIALDPPTVLRYRALRPTRRGRGSALRRAMAPVAEALNALVRAVEPTRRVSSKVLIGQPKGPQEPPLRSFCGPACREQPGIDENNRTIIPVFLRLSPPCAARLKVLILRLFIGEKGCVWLCYAVFGSVAVPMRSYYARDPPAAPTPTRMRAEAWRCGALQAASRSF